MEEYGTSQTWDNGFHIVADDDQRIVEVILPPHLFGAGGIRKLDEAIVAGIGGFIDPTVLGRQGANRQVRCRRPNPVLAIKDRNERVSAGRSCAVAFAFVELDAGTAHRRNGTAAGPMQTTVPGIEILVFRLRRLG